MPLRLHSTVMGASLCLSRTSRCKESSYLSAYLTIGEPNATLSIIRDQPAASMADSEYWHSR